VSPAVEGTWTATGAYAIATLAASVSVARRSAWRHLPVLPAAFAAVHVGYGTDFLAGLMKFRKRWGDRRASRPR
jgi:hypothetical protein